MIEIFLSVIITGYGWSFKKMGKLGKKEVSLFRPGNLRGNGIFDQELGMFRNV